MEFTKMSQNPYSGEGENRQVFYASEMKVSSLLSTFLEITIRKRDHFYVGFCVFHPAGVLLGSDWMKMGCSFPFFCNFSIGACFQSKKGSVSWKIFQWDSKKVLVSSFSHGNSPARWNAIFEDFTKDSSRQLHGFGPESTAGFFRVARTIKVVHAFKAEIVAFRGIRGRDSEET